MKLGTKAMDKRLMVPGYAGELSPDELAEIRHNLKTNRRLRAMWGFVRGTGKINDEKIRRIAMEGV